MARSILAFLAALVVAYLIAATLATQHVIGALISMGMPVGVAVWARTTAHDLYGMLPMFAPLLGVALLAALPVIALICRGRPGWRRIGYVTGFF